MHIDERSMTELLKETAGACGDQAAIYFQGKTVSFAQFDSLSDHVAANLAAKGIKKGDRVGLYCMNSDAFAIAYFGIVKAGAGVVPINLLLNPKEAEYILSDAGVSALFYFETFSDTVSAIRENIDSLSHCICIGSNKSSEEDSSFVEWLAADGPPPEVSFDPANDVAVIIYTSGTTGKPKGAMLTHRNLVSNTQSIQSALQLEKGRDVILVVLPMFHAFAATVGMLFPLLHGCTFVPLPKFDPEEIANMIEQHGVTLFMAVPSMYSVLLRLADAAVDKFASLRYCASGGAAMPLKLMEDFEHKFGKLIYEGDGPTECSPVTSVNPIGGLRKPGTIGKTVPFVEMKIVDSGGKELPHGEVGEICVRGPNVMKGYWNRPEETASSFFGEWFRTGDLGTEDDDGYFAIVDRLKDMVIVNGMNVYPRMVEEILYQHEAVREAAVIGEPHDMHGEIPVAYVSLKEDMTTTSASIRAFCWDHLGRHQIPKKVFFLDELPKNATGKILKRELRKHGELERGFDSRVEDSEVTS
ncbi:MAG: long-chain fatty acid--CoA ligase [Gammaproteobacteria bacterium]|jgi:long-chain acyl-CoA synthetase|nr:long-chain fatty acid--CoA ligase [Gammaproteobacteria bacterium]